MQEVLGANGKEAPPLSLNLVLQALGPGVYRDDRLIRDGAYFRAGRFIASVCAGFFSQLAEIDG